MNLTRQTFISLFMVLALLQGWEARAEESRRLPTPVKTSAFLSPDKYAYYEDKLCVSFQLVWPKGSDALSAVLLSSESSDKRKAFLMLDADLSEDRMALFLSQDMRLRKEVLPLDSGLRKARVLPVYIEMDMRKRLLRCSLTPGDTVAFPDVAFTVTEGYKFALQLDTLSASRTPSSLQQPAIAGLSVMANQSAQSDSSIYWYYMIGVADLLVFLFMYYRHRKKKQLGQDTDTLFKEPATAFHRPVLPGKQAIYLFGGMRILNREGEDISRKFSPTLRELLTLLIMHSDHKGISAEKMKAYLWPDKSVASARNNRAVNLGKLRNLLAEVGEFEIKGEDGYWRIDTPDVFIDYLTFRSILKTPGLLVRQDVEALCAIAGEGNILPEQPYPWLDDLRAEVSNGLFDKFLGFAETLDQESATDLYVGVADVMFKFERINEQALSIKCRAYAKSGRHSAAKVFYDKFCEEYLQVYGEEFAITFGDIIKTYQD